MPWIYLYQDCMPSDFMNIMLIVTVWMISTGMFLLLEWNCDITWICHLFDLLFVIDKTEWCIVSSVNQILWFYCDWLIKIYNDEHYEVKLKLIELWWSSKSEICVVDCGVRIILSSYREGLTNLVILGITTEWAWSWRATVEL